MPTGDEAGKSRRDSFFEVPYKEGQILGGKYRVIRLLGKGGMGYVLEAEHLHLGRHVAIKLLLPEHAKREEWVTRFMREARAASNLPSDHVVHILDVAMLDDSRPYIVMEYLEGVDLGGLLDQEGPISPGEAVGFVLQACVALEEAHDRGIVHRDLKPANLFLTHRKDGTPIVKVFDFGISKITNALWSSPEAANITSTQATMGSPSYMSPEQLRSARNVDQRSDIWSLGVILHELIAGVPPFSGESLSGVCAAVVADAPARLREVAPNAPAGLERVILQCLEKSPDKRPASVPELVALLRPFASEPTSRVSMEVSKEVDDQNPSTAKTLNAAPIAPKAAEEDLSLEGLLTGDPEEALPPEYRPEPRPEDPAAEVMGHSPTQPMPPPRPQPPWSQRSSSRQYEDRYDDDAGERSGAAVWIGVALGAVVVLGGLGFAGYRLFADRPAAPSSVPTASLDPTSTDSPLVSASSRTDNNSITLVLQVTPETAVVAIDGEVVTTRTLRYPKSDQPRKLVVSAPGYVTTENEFTTSVGGTLVVALKPEGKK
jgi:serine/threonine protein kinase